MITEARPSAILDQSSQAIRAGTWMWKNASQCGNRTNLGEVILKNKQTELDLNAERNKQPVEDILLQMGLVTALSTNRAGDPVSRLLQKSTLEVTIAVIAAFQPQRVWSFRLLDKSDSSRTLSFMHRS